MINACSINLKKYNSAEHGEGLSNSLSVVFNLLTPKHDIQEEVDNFLNSLSGVGLDINTKTKDSVDALIKDSNEIMERLLDITRNNLKSNSPLRKAKALSKINLQQLFRNAYFNKLKAIVGDNAKLIEDTIEETTNKENSEEYKNTLSLTNFENEIFSTAYNPKMHRRQLFNLDIVRATIIDTRTGKIVKDNLTLNNNIVSVKKLYYADILNFLKDAEIEGLSENMFDDSGNLNKDYIRTLNTFYKILKETPDLTNLLKNGWRTTITGGNNLLYKAVMAYFNLNYFDLLLKNTLGKVIEIDKNYTGYEVSKQFNKYSFNAKSITEIAKGWLTQESRDAITEWANFSKIIIESIPMFSRLSEKQFNTTVTTVSFANAFCSLFNTILYISSQKGETDSDILSLITKFHFDSTNFLKSALEKILLLKNIDKLIGRGLLTAYDIDVLYSVNRYLYGYKSGDTVVQEGVVDIENKELGGNFNPGHYSIIDTITGVIDRTMAINYLESKIDENGDTTVGIKQKFNRRRREITLRNSINSVNYNRSTENKETLYKKYNPVLNKSNYSWTVTIGGKLYSIWFDKGHNIFSIPINNENLNLVHIKNLTDSTDDKIVNLPEINIRTNIETLLGDESLLELKKLDFKNVLKFIEDSLSPLDLLSEIGLEKLMISEMNDSNIIKSLFVAALRALAINTYNTEYAIDVEEGLVSEDESFYSYVSNRHPEVKYTDKTKYYWMSGLGERALATSRNSDSWIDTWVTAEASVYGDISKANTKDAFGNSVGNYSTAFLGGNIAYYLYLANNKYNETTRTWETRPDSALAHLLFSKQMSLVQGIVANTDSTEKNGVKKLVRLMKTGELLYLSIFHNFYTSLLFSSDLLKDSSLILPTTYSDKTKDILYALNMRQELKSGIAPDILGRSYEHKTLILLNEDEILDLYLDTIGLFYKLAYENTINKFNILFGTSSKEEVLAEFNKINNASTKEEIYGIAIKYGLTLNSVPLNKLREELLITLAESKGIELTKESDYKVDNNKIYFNDLLDYYVNHLYANKENLRERLNEEKRNFINDIIKSNSIFYTEYIDSEGKKLDSTVSRIIDELYDKVAKKGEMSKNNEYRREWVKDGKLILAKTPTKTYIMGETVDDSVTDLQLNPILEKYFLEDSLLSHNLRLSLNGSETAHPPKTSVIDVSQDPDWKKLHKQIINTETKAQGALLKRNVIIPGTLQYYKLNTIIGVGSFFHMAVANDLKIPVFNFKGDITWLDSCDGAALTTATASILENNSLQDLKVGDIKKSILHSPIYSNGGAVLGKWATFAITNELIRNALDAKIDLYEINKKLTDIAWYINTPDGQRILNSEFIDVNRITTGSLDLTNVRGSKGMRKLQFGKDILKGRKLYYKDEAGKIYSIVNFGKDETTGFYYTEIEDTDLAGTSFSSTRRKVYHGFDAQSNHFTSTDVNTLIEKGYTTINSNFQLWETLGGLQSVEMQDRTFQDSENSNYALVEFMNMVAYELSGNRKDLSQTNYYQPLKNTQISYLANLTSIKNGASNVNLTVAWTDKNYKLHHFKVQYDGIGILMDADHEADEALLTEFSLVIAALAAGGRMHHISRQVYKDLENIALATSLVELDALRTLVASLLNNTIEKGEAISELYDIVTRVITNHFKSKNQANLTDEYLLKIKRHLNENATHVLDRFKMPFSDPGIYSQLLPTFISKINLKSVKRKYPGSGYVMHPSYGFVLVYDIRTLQADGTLSLKAIPYQFLDIYNLHSKNVPKLETESFVQYQKRVVKDFLAKYLEQIIAEETSLYANPLYENLVLDRTRFYPNSKVLVRITNRETKEVKLVKIDLSDPSDYVAFKSSYWTYFMKDKLDTNGNTLTELDLNFKTSTVEFFTDVTSGRDLNPAKITWKDSKGAIWNIFDTKAIRAAFTNTVTIKQEIPGTKPVVKYIAVPKSWNKAKINDMVSSRFAGFTVESITENKVDNSAIQETFELLSKGKFLNINDLLEDITDLQNSAAEVIMGNMNASKFPVKGSLVDILNNPKGFRINRINYETNIDSDLLFLKQDRKHVSIKIGNVVSDANDLTTPQSIKWENIKPVYEKNSDGTINRNKVLIYALSNDADLLFPIGFGKINNDLIYKSKTEALDKKTNKIIKGDYMKADSGDAVMEIKYFVKKYNVFTSTDETVKKDILYSIDRDLIEEADYNSEKTVAKLDVESEAQENAQNEKQENKLKIEKSKRTNRNIADILSIIFAEENGLEIRVNNPTDRINLSRIVDRMYFDTGAMEELKTGIVLFLKIKAPTSKDKKAYDASINNFYNKMSVAMQSSFARLLEVVSSRIPALTLLSFMQMQCIGFIKSGKAVAYVTPWLTYLQGSDYDIDKAYIMGCSIDKNGIYKAWSPLFDYNTINTLKASELLPFPVANKLLRLVKKEDGVKSQDITSYIKTLVDLESLKPGEEHSIKYLNAINKLINFRNNKNNIGMFNVYVDPQYYDRAKVYINLVNRHQRYYLSQENKEAAYRNSISSKIGHVVLALPNMNYAYSPVEMGHIRPEESGYAHMSLLNPATKYIMLETNMVGKGVIGITAVGEKIFFNLTHYWNETLRYKPYNYKNLAFEHTYSRILDRSLTGKPTKVKKDKLANVNFDFQGVEFFVEKVNTINSILELTKLELGYDRSTYETLLLDKNSTKYKLFLAAFHRNIRRNQSNLDLIDLFISELLSAATDNAKELILNQINAGLELAGNYLYLLTLGFNVRDIIAFMTSPALQVVNSLSKFNMFNTNLLAITIPNLVQLLRGDLSKLFYTKPAEAVYNKINSLYKSDEKQKKDEPKNEEELAKLEATVLEKPKKSKDEINKENFHNYIKDRIDGKGKTLRQLMPSIDYAKADFVELIISNIKEYLNGLSYDEYLQDLEEFETVKNQAEEATRLGNTLLGLNLGLPTSEVDLLKKFKGIKDIIDKREELLGLNDKFLEDVIKDIRKQFKDSKEKFDETKHITIGNVYLSKTFKDKVNELKDKNKALVEVLDKDYRESLKEIQDQRYTVTNPESSDLYFSRILATAIVGTNKFDPTINKFNPRSWLSNVDYQKFIIEYYNIIKDTWNIFDVVENVPLYNALLTLLRLEYLTNHHLSIKSAVIDKVHNDLIQKNRFLDEDMLNNLIGYVDDRLIDSWFEERNLSMPILKDWKTFNTNRILTSIDVNSFIDLNDPKGLASFKYVFENYIIPGLKDGSLPVITTKSNSKGRPTIIADPDVKYELKNNAFISGLVPAQSKDNKPFYKLNMDMMNIEATAATLQQFQDYIDGLLELRNVYLGELNLADWFMVYNLHVNNNRFGEDRLTSIFRPFIQLVGEDDNNVLNNYYTYVGNLDYNLTAEEGMKKLGINEDDIYIAMAKVISSRMEAFEKSDYIKEYENGYPVYKRKVKGLYVQLPLFPNRTLLYNEEAETVEAKKNTFLYYLRNYPNQETVDYYMTKLASTELDDLIEALQVLQSKELINVIIFNC